MFDSYLGATHFFLVLKDFIDQKRDEKMYKKSGPIFRCTTPSTGKRFGEVVVGTLMCVVWLRGAWRDHRFPEPFS